MSRRNDELLGIATAMAAGSSTGFTGNDKPLRSLERSLKGTSSVRDSAGMKKVRDHLHDQLARWKQEGKVE